MLLFTHSFICKSMALDQRTGERTWYNLFVMSLYIFIFVDDNELEERCVSWKENYSLHSTAEHTSLSISRGKDGSIITRDKKKRRRREEEEKKKRRRREEEEKKKKRRDELEKSFHYIFDDEQNDLCIFSVLLSALLFSLKIPWRNNHNHCSLEWLLVDRKRDDFRNNKG